jgi:preprotein translocase subunit SecD
MNSLQAIDSTRGKRIVESASQQRALRFTAKMLIVVLLMGLSVGCKTTDTEKEYRDYITLHEFERVDRYNNLDQAVEIAPGRYIQCRKIPVMTSATIRRIKPYRRDAGDYGLEVFLNKHGVNKWMNVTTEFRGRPLAVLIDAEFKQFIRVTSRVGDDTFVIDGGFTREEATRISENAESNYFEQEKKSSVWNLIN